MQKTRMKLQILLGTFLLLTALTGGKNPVWYASPLHPINIVSAIPVQAATNPSVAEYVSPIIYCSTCHESVNALAPESIALGNEKSVLMEDHTERIVQCVSCHAETLEMNTIQMGEPE